MIDLRNVTKIFPNGTKALNNVNLHIDDGEFVFITGHNGAGKSTLLKLLLKEDEPTEGTIKVNEYNLNKLPNKKVPYYRRTLGIVFQDFKLFEKSTAAENIAFAMRVIGEKEKRIRARVPRLLELVDLPDKGDNFPEELSGGEQQRVSLARAIANNPNIIIADEPTANIDSQMRWAIMDMLLQFNQRGKTIIVITHDEDYVKASHKRVIKIAHGEIVSDIPAGKESAE